MPNLKSLGFSMYYQAARQDTKKFRLTRYLETFTFAKPLLLIPF